jgi:hypothetical protein
MRYNRKEKERARWPGKKGEKFNKKERESTPLGCVATKAKKERAMATRRERDSVEGKICAPPKYVATNRKERASMPRTERVSMPRKNKGVLLRGKSMHTLGMYCNREERVWMARGKVKEI